MKKAFLVIFVMLIGYTTLYANPTDNIQGLVSFSETQTLYFDTEQNAIKWIESQADFMANRELADGQRRLVESMISGMIPNFQDLVRLFSDYCIMVERSPIIGESLLQFYVQGRLTRLWTY